ncbi:ribosomal-processing cysteine protease Prp [Streptobacillus moniliformis]|uniref:ribosomal-processing cysteine protease Prp n=1 Tax=Streptobacillus moniliformis TaxID=34105 RepID=UPI0007E31727|nr:ribosomal-processing cysteine protease Prp [Streptobacillus moniliformis]
MTYIEFSEKEDKIVSYLIKGHTGAYNYGEDIVCASISATSIMTLNGLIEVLKIKKLNYEMRDGYIFCDLRNVDEDDLEKSQSLIKSLAIMLESIAKDYPKNVQFRTRRYEK